MSLLHPIISNNDTIDSSQSTANFSHTSLNPPDSSFVKLNIGSLNCRGLTKTAAASTRSQFILRYLRTRSLDLLALQETHASSSSIQDMFHSQFQASSSIWSPHCGLLSFSSNISFSNSIASICGRIISATIPHSSDALEPFSATVVYFPASRSERLRFLSTVLTDYCSVFSSFPSRSIVLGDCNYTYSNTSSSRNQQAPHSWLQYIDDHFFNGVTPPGKASCVTFQRGISQSCIDYIMLSNDLASSVAFDHCNTSYIQPVWSEHFQISSQLRLHRLFLLPLFKQQLYKALSKRVTTFDTSLSAAQKWEQLKLITAARTAKSFSRRLAYILSRAEDLLLHKKRTGLSQKLSIDPALRPVLDPQLKVVEDQLATLQKYHVETLALRSGIRWRERGAIPAGYLKRSVASRVSKKLIPPLIHPTSQSRCTTKEDMLDAAATFYTDLYSPDAIDPQAISDLLDALPASLRLSDSAAASVIAPIFFEDLVEAFSQVPEKSSPGTDGLPYQHVRLIVLHPECREIVLATFNNALSFADVPLSWLESCVSLLPKYGALDLLKNWRPIALINTDVKVFTRILSARMIETASALINPFQTGFVRDRFVADNGMLMKLVMEHAKLSSSSSIGLLLDQEKAYDRVHPTYLRAMCLAHMVINVNGFLSPRVPQCRGLKQGDPISPILFNLALEPLLRRILADSTLLGYALPLPASTLPPTTAAPTTVKMLAYADDIICLLNSPAVLQQLQSHRHVYSRASNAITWRSASLQHNITAWHDARSPTSVRYLGFPLYIYIAQRNVFLEQLLDKVRQGCLIHQQRGLSVRGRSTVLNSLILSKLWHILRVITVPVSFFNSINSVIPSFINFRIFPRISPPTSSVYQTPPQQLDHRFSLLFPRRRPSPLRHNKSSWSLLFKAIDRLPKDFSDTVVSASICLEIPLASVTLPSSSSVELGRSLTQ
ncbi:hypothetical protein [Parasitella parasitica]|uniref:Reverse transcriptase domain-containing protein n=1 Tax=Parasitella parasitica TaxID=35722 RepID=A0A0B7NY60_9FUNG|nr:hypothetical protein [Parasitella parasitica]